MVYKEVYNDKKIIEKNINFAIDIKATLRIMIATTLKYLMPITIETVIDSKYSLITAAAVNLAGSPVRNMAAKRKKQTHKSRRSALR